MDNPYRLFVYLIPYSTLMSAPEGCAYELLFTSLPLSGAGLLCYSLQSIESLTSLAQSVSLKG